MYYPSIKPLFTCYFCINTTIMHTLIQINICCNWTSKRTSNISFSFLRTWLIEHLSEHLNEHLNLKWAILLESENRLSEDDFRTIERYLEQFLKHTRCGSNNIIKPHHNHHFTDVWRGFSIRYRGYHRRNLSCFDSLFRGV